MEAFKIKKSAELRTYVPETITKEEQAETERLIKESGGMDTLFKGKLKNLREGATK